MLVFVKGGKPENLTKHPWSNAKTNNKRNPEMAQPNLGHIGRRRALSPLHHPCSPISIMTSSFLSFKLSLMILRIVEQPGLNIFS